MGEFEVFDLKRMFLGEEPAWFLLEVVFRTTFMFLYTLLLVRITGKRGLGELSPFELLMVVALGSAVGDPMFYADVPLLHAMAVVTVIIFLQRAVAYFVDHSEQVEQFIEGVSRRLVTGGVVDIEALRSEHFSRDELFMLLREEGVEQLGQVKRAYLEPSGRVSVWLYEREKVREGLPLVPASDPSPPDVLEATDSATEAGNLACRTCGFVREVKAGDVLGPCTQSECEDGWVVASAEVGPGRRDEEGGQRTRRRGPLGR